MRRFLLLPPLVFLLVSAMALPSFAARSRFRATLSGQQEVPPAQTNATGYLKLTLSKDVLTFELSVNGVMNFTGAHIHRGKRGENGPPIAGLTGGPEGGGEVNGILAEGTITEESLLGELRGMKIADLVRLIKSGETYVNIHTWTFPDGEIRGQLR
jgi:hypothetical protein